MSEERRFLSNMDRSNSCPKILVLVLCWGILSLTFLHDHQPFVGNADIGETASEYTTRIRHVHPNEHASHYPLPKSDEHEAPPQWSFLEHVGLTTLAANASTHLLATLSHVNIESGEGYSLVLSQRLWEPITPVRGSPVFSSYGHLTSSNWSLSYSGRAPPPSVV